MEQRVQNDQYPMSFGELVEAQIVVSIAADGAVAAVMNSSMNARLSRPDRSRRALLNPSITGRRASTWELADAGFS